MVKLVPIFTYICMLSRLSKYTYEICRFVPTWVQTIWSFLFYFIHFFFSFFFLPFVNLLLSASQKSKARVTFWIPFRACMFIRLNKNTLCHALFDKFSFSYCVCAFDGAVDLRPTYNNLLIRIKNRDFFSSFW